MSPDVVIVPRDWGGSGLLGMLIRYDTFEGARQNVISVQVQPSLVPLPVPPRFVKCCLRFPVLIVVLAPQNVVPGSPADKAGLKPLTDIICGTQDATFRSSVHLCGVMVMLA